MNVRTVLRYMRPRNFRQLMVETERLRRKERTWPLRHRRPRLWLRGFLSVSATIYDFDAYGTDAYVSDYARLVRTPGINPPQVRTVISNKLARHGHMSSTGLDHLKPLLLGVIESGRFHGITDGLDTFRDLLESEPHIVVKPVASGGGKGVMVVERTATGLSLNGQLRSKRALVKRLASTGSCVVERRLTQHRYASTIYPRTVNTL